MVITDNQMQKGPNSDNWGTAIHIGGGARPGSSAYPDQPQLRSDNPHEVAFVRNETVVPAALEGNQLEGMVIALVGPGTVDQAERRGEVLVGRGISGDQWRRTRWRDLRPRPISRRSCACSSACSRRS